MPAPADTTTAAAAAPAAAKPYSGPVDAEGKPLRMCCACPDTKSIRDKCVMEKGEQYCDGEINKHKECLRLLGFKV